MAKKPLKDKKSGAFTAFVIAPKGGTGKTMTCKHMLVLGQQNGMKVVGIDLDSQQGLKKWSDRRTVTAEQYRESGQDGPEPIEVVPMAFSELRSKFPAIKARADLVVVDTPASLEPSVMNIVLDFARECDLNVIPCGPSYDDVDSLYDFVELAMQNNIPVQFVLSKFKRTTVASETKDTLREMGMVCPTIIFDYTDMNKYSKFGLCVADSKQLKGYNDVEAFWYWASNEMEKQR